MVKRPLIGLVIRSSGYRIEFGSRKKAAKIKASGFAGGYSLGHSGRRHWGTTDAGGGCAGDPGASCAG